MQNIDKKLVNFDHMIIHLARKYTVPMARFAVFICYFYFGILKVLGASPASALVLALLDRTMPFMQPDTFLIAFGIIEMIIGILFIIPRFERLAVFTLFLHLITTVMPLVLLPQFVWTGTLVPTLEGQYIIKNILLVLAGMVLLANLHSYKETQIENV